MNYKKRLSIKKKRTITFFLYISPWLIGFLAFTLIPMILSLIYSFTNVKMINVASKPLDFIGFDNYIRVFSKDPDFIQSILNTLVYSFSKIIFLIIFAVIFAVLLNSKLFGKKFIRVLYYLPAIIPVVCSSLLWKLIFTGGEKNIINFFLSYLGLAPVNFFGSGSSAMATVVFIGVWSGLGPNTFILIAAIQNVSKEMLEAGKIDGTNKISELFYLIIPAILPAIFFISITGFIGGLQTYTEIKLLTEGGPGNSTMTMSMLIVSNAFKQTGNKTLGYASAQGWIVFLITSIFSAIYMMTSFKKEKQVSLY
ncbi:MAG: sugar ABC transporter permease [Bacillales bacterium]|jgi:ABC-type sugar transport system permease subunit|nr:sugar ABC transporter permease [Bacillales bacterium]